MPERVKYAYVILDSRGACWAVTNGDTQKIEGLPALFGEGWKPVRETAFPGNSGTPYLLILLERDAEPAEGFGFQS
ncbi:hypothetical protein BH23PLA1_BH23PLA1_40540 [soil metagenome]